MHSCITSGPILGASNVTCPKGHRLQDPPTAWGCVGRRRFKRPPFFFEVGAGGEKYKMIYLIFSIIYTPRESKSKQSGWSLGWSIGFPTKGQSLVFGLPDYIYFKLWRVFETMMTTWKEWPKLMRSRNERSYEALKAKKCDFCVL